MPQKIYIRADGNSEIGLGHVIRSLALAEMLKEAFDCIFVTRFLTDYIHTEAGKVCSEIIKLPESDDHFNAFLSLLSGNEIVVLDNYFFTTDNQQKIKSKGCQLVCIDDMHDKHFVADVVINHSSTANKKQYSMESYTQLCLGMEYALLRKPFREEIKVTNSQEIKQINSIFVCFGGADCLNLTEKTIEVLLQKNNIKRVFAVIGDANIHAEKLKNDFKDNPMVSILTNLSSEEMVRVLKETDLAIVPSSSVLLEVFSIGIPIITGFYAKNQEEGSNFIVKQGLATGVDLVSEKYPELLSTTLDTINLSDCSQMVALQKQMIKDAESSYIKVFKELSMKTTTFYSFKNFTSLSEAEIYQVWEWRNHAEIRKWMYNQDIIPLEKHIQFITGLKNNITKLYWLVQRKNISIGVLSVVDIKENCGEWGFYIAPEFREKYLGVEFYYYSLGYLFNVIRMKKLYGHALVKNTAAVSLGNLFGFHQELMVKEIDGIAQDFYFSNLTKEKFNNEIQNNSKILKLLNFTSSENI